jgi:hypothetical protein
MPLLVSLTAITKIFIKAGRNGGRNWVSPLSKNDGRGKWYCLYSFKITKLGGYGLKGLAAGHGGQISVNLPNHT